MKVQPIGTDPTTEKPATCAAPAVAKKSKHKQKHKQKQKQLTIAATGSGDTFTASPAPLPSARCARPLAPAQLPSYPPVAATDFSALKSPSRDSLEDQASNYPPPGGLVGLDRYNLWRAQHAPLTHTWETQAMPWLLQACGRARLAAHATKQHAVQKMRESFDPQTRELTAQIRQLHGASRAERPQGWLISLHQMRVGLEPRWLEGRQRALTRQSVPYVDPRERRVESELMDDPWILLPD